MRCRPDQAEQLGALAAQTWPVDPAAVRAHLGLYSDGFLVRLDDTGALYLDHDIRSMPVLAMPEGGDVVVDGPGGDGWAGRQDRARLTVFRVLHAA
jgi:hypothetical protein